MIGKEAASDHPVGSCGKHHPTGRRTPSTGSPECCCGRGTWLNVGQASVCTTGREEGEPTIEDDEDFLRDQAGNAPYLLIQLVYKLKEVDELKERLDKLVEDAAKTIWKEMGFEVIQRWKGRYDAAEERIQRTLRQHSREPRTGTCNDCGSPWPCETWLTLSGELIWWPNGNS